MDTPLLTADETAEILRISRQRLLRLVRRNLVPHVRLPDDEIRFQAGDLATWLESRKSAVATTTEAAQ